ncbi:MAG: binary toxin-like calcium binding domain-containing protein, partial [Bacteroidota bacterium]
MLAPAALGQTPDSVAAAGVASDCPTGVDPEKDLDGDCVDDDLERAGYGRDLTPCTPNPEDPGCFVTDPTAWSSDGDPYSDFQEATGVNMDNTIEPPFNTPLVAASPRVEVALHRYRFTPKATITDSEGREVSSSSTQEFSVSATAGVSYTAGVEVSGGLNAGVTASTETTVSYSVTAGYSESQTSGESLNWETATTAQTDDAASLALDIMARNVGSATALDVTPTFNLFLGDEPLGTIVPDQAFPASLRPDGRWSDFITVDRRKKGNTNEEITLSMEQLRRLQRGAPIKIQVVGIDARISRWRPEDSNWSCPEPCQWEDFQNQIDARTLRLIVDFGYSGDPSALIPRQYAGNPFEYRVYTGSPNARPGFTLRDVLGFIGYEMQEQEDQTLIRERAYPKSWYATSGPDAGGTSRDSTFFDYWTRAGQPERILDMVMPRGVALLMASPDPEDPGPVISGDLVSESMRRLIVAAAPKGSIPVKEGEAHLVLAGGRSMVVPMHRLGGTSYFATPDSLPLPIGIGSSYAVLRDVLGNERIVGPGLRSGYPVAASCEDILPHYYREPRFADTEPGTRDGVVTVFIDGDLDRPATAFCVNDGAVIDYWYPQVNDMGAADVMDVAVLDLERRVAVGENALLYSEDAGQSWRRAELAPEDATTFHAVAFREGTDVGIAVGDGSVFMRTVDGGRTWARVDVAVGAGNYFAVDYAGGDTWYAVGQRRVRRSSDNGLTWDVASVIVVDEDGNEISRPAFAALRAVSFISEDVGVIGDPLMGTDEGGEQRGRVYLTTNGGVTWREHLVFTNLNDIVFDGDDAWYVIGRNVIYRLGYSSDARNGVVFTAPTSHVLMAGSFVSPEIGYVVADRGPVYRTDDGGETWAAPFGGYPTPTHPGANFMRDIAMVDANIGAVVGTDGVIGATDSGGGVPAMLVSIEE